jgi:hypothetical protein
MITFYLSTSIRGESGQPFFFQQGVFSFNERTLLMMTLPYCRLFALIVYLPIAAM